MHSTWPHQNFGYIAITALLDHIHTIAAIVVVSIALVAFSMLFHLLIGQKLNTAIKRFLLGAPVRWALRG